MYNRLSMYFVILVTPKLLGQLCTTDAYQAIKVDSRRFYKSRLSRLSTALRDSFDGNQPAPRRRKNKYEKFSKIQTETDPLEQLMQESEQKNQQLSQELEEKQRRKQQHRLQQKNSMMRRASLERTGAKGEEATITPVTGPLEFPDNKSIDPYDPTSFGYIEIGTIIGAHGVHGLVKLRSTTDFPMQRLCTAGIRHLKPAKKRAPRQITLLGGRHRHEDEYLLQFEDIETRDDALRLRGSTLYVREEEKAMINNDKRPKTQGDEEDKDTAEEPDEYLVSDLVGLEVFLFEMKEEAEDIDLETASSSALEMFRGAFVGTVGGIVFADEIGTVGGLGHDLLEIILPRGDIAGGAMPSFRDELVLIPFVPQLVPIVDISERMICIDPPEGLLDLTYVREDRVRIKGFLPSG